jgi:signal transduction histidine kinase
LNNTEAAEIYLSKDPPDLTQIKDILADIRRADQRAGDIVKHFRKLLKPRSELELQRFDLNDALRDAVQLLTSEAKDKGIELNLLLPDEPAWVKADDVHIEQAVVNLMTNAMDAMIDIPQQRRRIQIHASPGDARDYVEVCVADSGPGIPGDKVDRVFEAFYTTKAHGTGLGLSITRSILETYGGNIWAENGPKGGAVFRFALPLADKVPT